MNMIAKSFAYVFSEDDWFNKVLVGGFYILLFPLSVGMVMIMGFQIAVTRRILNGENGFPLWRNTKTLFILGLRAFCVSLWYAGFALTAIMLLNIPVISVETAGILLAFHFLLNPVIIRCFSETDSIVTCINPVTLLRFVGKHFLSYVRLVVLTTGMIITAALLGWMWIVVAWTMLIFLMMIVQTISFAKM